MYTHQFVKTRVLILLLAIPLSNAWATDPDNAVSKENSFDIGLYMGAHQKVKLNLAVRQKKPVSVTLKDAKNAVMYRRFLKKSPMAHHLSFDFAASESGVFQLEISDGQRTIVRRVEVVDLPATESNRFVVFNPLASR